MRKIQNKSYYIVCVAFLICILLLTGCGSTYNESEQMIPTDTGSSAEHLDNTETVAPSESTQTPEDSQTSEDLQTTEDSQVAEDSQTTEDSQAAEDTQVTEDPQELEDPAAASLVSLRQALVGTPQRFAVAYFGYAVPDGNMPANPYAVMEETAPQLCDDLPFIQQIPQQNVLGTDGHLFCIVPADENATVSVNWSLWDEATETFGEANVLYRSKSGDPILLMTTNTGWCTETEVIITDSNGDVTIWYPFIDEDNRIAQLNDENGVSLYYDFSPYDLLN